MNNFECMKSDISKLKGVEYVDIILNNTGYFDHHTQLQPYSFRVIVSGGKLKKIAKVVWFHKPIGALTMGNTEVKFKDGFGFKNFIKLEVKI